MIQLSNPPLAHTRGYEREQVALFDLMLRFLSVLLAFPAAQSLAAGAAPATRPPNVLFLAVDDLRVNLGCYGDKAAITPRLDELAARGLRFTRAYAQQAVCNPSRQSLLTGRRPDTIRVWDLKTHFRQTAPGIVTLPEYFKHHGYMAQSFGKIFHGESPMADPPSWSAPEQFPYIAKRDDYRLPENRAPAGQSAKAAATEFVDAPENEYPDTQVAAAAITALERYAAGERRQPFFLAVGICKPHLPFTAPKHYWDLYANVALPPVAQPRAPIGAPDVALHSSVEIRGYTDLPRTGAFSADQTARLRRGYYAATSFADGQFGRVLDALKRAGLERETVIVFWSDHGFHLGEHGLWAKTTNYEADTRVPLIFSYPGQPHRGKSTPALSGLIDIYPTLVDLCGLPMPGGLEGRSLRPWLESPERPGPAAAFSQFPRPFPFRGQPEIMGYAVRSATHRYVEWRRFGTNEVIARELYAYPGDALFETENLVSRPAEAGRIHELAELIPTQAAGNR
jgi:iduronate 2-sulfatase